MIAIFHKTGVAGRTEQREPEVVGRERLGSKSFDTLLNSYRLLRLVVSEKLTMYNL
ncbi:MAG: hypothetical protein IJ756_08420 [Paludibacteraceae bacterium]|nr:hypothetical protein [Paludibacteraceae bacterium]